MVKVLGDRASKREPRALLESGQLIFSPESGTSFPFFVKEQTPPKNGILRLDHLG
jgi:hypothetical protein